MTVLLGMGSTAREGIQPPVGGSLFKSILGSSLWEVSGMDMALGKPLGTVPAHLLNPEA